MTRILIEAPVFSASVKIGVIDALKLFEGVTYNFLPTSDITAEDIAQCDVLVTVRGAEYLSYCVVNAAKKAGRFIAYFLDDDLLHVPVGDAVSQTYYDVQVRNYLPKIMELSDVLWCVNPKISVDYGKYIASRRISINRIPVGLPAFDTRRTLHSDNEPLSFLYAGSKSHTTNVQNVISPAVRRIYEEYGNRVDFCFIGADPKLNFVKFIPFFDDYDKYREFVTARRFDFGLAVVGEDEFYQSKYFNKYIEYTQLGCIGIYSGLQPYTDVIADGVNGYLYDNTPEGLYAVLKKIICGEIPAWMLENAYNDISSHSSPEAVREVVAASIPELISFNALKTDSDKIKIKKSDGQLYLLYARIIFRQYALPIAIWICVAKVVRRIVMKLTRSRGTVCRKNY